ncbi:MAG: ATP-NAD kinase family protein [Candidatus Bathyarchaeia archaeon]|nr:ATP-NAD kinase family protein [Candidatus Bathyarchaeota archaeon]
MKILGLIVNPMAGIGGRVGLKGSDGAEVQRKALELGAEPSSPRRAAETLRVLRGLNLPVRILTYAGSMGQVEAEGEGFECEVVGSPKSSLTDADDTKRAARLLQEAHVNLLLFVGGDGTARDILDSLNPGTVALGVPAGVKVYSAVFAVNPTAAAELTARYLQGQTDTCEGEVMDIDEEEFRRGHLAARLYGYMTVPCSEALMQRSKEGPTHTDDEAENQRAIARHVIECMEVGRLYILGPGSTVRAVAEALGIEKTLLGVDVVKDGKIVAVDVNEAELLNLIGKDGASLIVTPIGGQGYIFGRGNQQLSPEVLRRVGKENVIVIATRRKILSLKGRPLLVDTGDPELDKEFHGYLRVITDYGEETVMKVC